MTALLTVIALAGALSAIFVVLGLIADALEHFFPHFGANL